MAKELLYKRETCAAIHINGRRCRKLAVRVVQYHGDSQFYGYFHEPWPSWIRAALCEVHSDPPREPKRTTKR